MEQNPRGKRPIGRPKIRWEDLVKKERIGKIEQWIEKNGRIGCEMESSYR